MKIEIGEQEMQSRRARFVQTIVGGAIAQPIHVLVTLKEISMYLRKEDK